MVLCMSLKKQKNCITSKPNNLFPPVRCELINFRSELHGDFGGMSYRRQDVGVSSEVSKLRKVLFYANVQRLPMGMKTAGLVSLGRGDAEVQRDAREVNLRCEQ